MNTGIPSFPLPIVSAFCHGIPAFLWTIIAWDLCHYAYQRRPTSHFFRIAPVVATLMALHFALHVVKELTPTQLDGGFPGLHANMELVVELIALWSAGTFRHLVRVMPIAEDHPSRRWLAVHYGVLVVLSALTVVLLWSDRHAAAMTISGAYMVVIGGISIYQMRAFAQRGAWNPGGLQIRSVDVAFGLIALVGGGGLVLVWLAAGGRGPQGTFDQIVFLFFHTAYGLGFAFPFAIRMLGRLIRIFSETTVMFVLAALFAWVIFPRLTLIEQPESRRLAELVAVLLLALLLSTGHALMGTAAQWKRTIWARWPVWRHIRPLYALFQPSPRLELQRFLTTLSPEGGITACAERAVRCVFDVLELRGAAIILLQDRGCVTSGQAPVAPLVAAWKQLAPAMLPSEAFVAPELRELPLPVRQAFLDSDAVGVVPIVSPRQTWGHLFIWTGFMEIATSDGGVATLQTFADQLALVFDSAELLARAVEVERSLAHAEKLAAIGELAARVAHEMRNPVTAARSLAQQLMSERDDPFRSEHGVILTELERVERQVAALLRFARRDEFRFEPVELSGLLRAIADEFRPRCDAAGIHVNVTAADSIVARGDREKLRQVLINLMENAVDALAEAPAPREVGLTLGRRNGSAHLEIRDNGVGVSAEAMAHLFEPFYSLKSHGTGLGLSIAKRTIDAHHGHIHASAADPGLAFEITLPLASADDPQMEGSATALPGIAKQCPPSLRRS